MAEVHQHRAGGSALGEVIAQAIGMFAVTNIDDIVVLSVFFGRAAGTHGGARSIVIGQYLGFGAILVVSVTAALGATLLPESAIAYLGLVPLAIGLRAGWEAWRDRRSDDQSEESTTAPSGPSIGQVASVTFANGADNIGVYVPVFAAAGRGSMSVYVIVFLVMVGLLCAAGHAVATRPPIARVLNRWGDVILAVVLVALGLYILIEGGAFGL